MTPTDGRGRGDEDVVSREDEPTRHRVVEEEAEAQLLVSVEGERNWINSARER